MSVSVVVSLQFVRYIVGWMLWYFSGSVSREQYCQLKGSKTDDGFLHLCSTCAVITQLPDDYFPRFINEAVCKTGDSNCFLVNGRRKMIFNLMK